MVFSYRCNAPWRCVAPTLFNSAFPHIHLAGDRRRDEGGAVLLQPLDHLLDLGDESVDLGGLAIKMSNDGFLP
jgi:hypothetical protein